MIRTLKSLAIAFGITLVLASATLRADEWNKKTIFTFSGPVMVGKTELAGGTYVFKLADTSDRHVVEIWNADETHIIATMIAIPAYRVTPRGHTVVKFSEQGTEYAGTVPDAGVPIKEWFYPGDNFGQEFRVYPQKQVAEVQEPVATTETNTTTTEAEATPVPAPEAAPAPAPAPEAEAAPAPEPQTEEAAPAPAPEETAPATQEQLPQTASDLPLFGMVGALALAAAASLRIFMKISA